MTLKLPEKITRVNGEDRAALKYAIMEVLKDLHPDLYFDVKNVKYDDEGFFFGLACGVRNPPDCLREVAAREGLRTMERIGEFALVDYVPGKKKPYVLRRKNGDFYTAGEDFVKKVFSKNVDQVEAQHIVRKVMGG